MSEQKEKIEWPSTGGLQKDPKCAGMMLDNFGLQVDLKPEPNDGPEDWDPPDPRWPPIQVDWDGHIADANTDDEGGYIFPPEVARDFIAASQELSFQNVKFVMPPCTPSRRETLTGGLNQIWDGAKQVIGALKP